MTVDKILYQDTTLHMYDWMSNQLKFRKSRGMQMIFVQTSYNSCVIHV